MEVRLTKVEWDILRDAIHKLVWIRDNSTDKHSSVGITAKESDMLISVIDSGVYEAVTVGPHSKVDYDNKVSLMRKQKSNKDIPLVERRY